MTRESPYFNCGELKPISITSFPGGGVNPGGGGGGGGDPGDPGVVISINIPLNPLRGREYWRCSCFGPIGDCPGCAGDTRCETFISTGPINNGPVYSSEAECIANAGSDPNCLQSRATCNTISLEGCSIRPCYSLQFPGIQWIRDCECLPPGQRQPTEFATKAACEPTCFDITCVYTPDPGYKCVGETTIICPDGSEAIQRRCVPCPCYGETGCDFRTLEECEERCPDDECPPVSTGTQNPSTGGGGSGGGGTGTGYKCVVTEDFPCGQTNGEKRDCVSCTVGPSDPECVAQSLATCERYCKDDICKYKCDPVVIECDDPNGQGTVEVSGGACVECLVTPGTPPVGPCRYNTKEECEADCKEPVCLYKCEEDFREPCPPPFKVGTERILRSCKACTSSDQGCTLTLQECEQQCLDDDCERGTKIGYILDKSLNSCRLCTSSEIKNNSCQYTNLEDCLRDQIIIEPIDPSDPRTEFNRINNFLADTKLDLKINKPSKVIDFSKGLDNQNLKTVEDIYNFYEYPEILSTKIVDNFYYLNIFKDRIAEEILYFFNRKSYNNFEWSEKHYYTLTLAKISQSLREDLLLAISNIHGLDGSIINSDEFLETIKRLIITDKLNEFDPEFYKSLFEKQKLTTVVDYVFPKNTELKTRASLGLLAQEAISANPIDYNNYFKFITLRKKRFNTDINANINITTESNETLFIPLKDAGLEITTNDASGFISIGYGDNYFIPYYDETSTENELPLESNLDKAWYVTEGTRIAAFNALGILPICDITVSSNNNQHEFISTYELSTTPEPMYFALVLSSVQTLSTTNQYVTDTIGVYERLTDLSSINQHIINYGLTAKRLNVDYRDPFIHYAKETEKISIKYNDITFKYFDNQSPIPSEINSDILTRTAPMGLIIVPGCGSRHNPYHGTSQLLNVSGPIVSRVIKGSLNLNLYLDGQFNISSTITEQTLSPPKENYGFSDRLVFSFNSDLYKNTYFVNGQYQSTPPSEPVKKPITSYIVNDITDKLIIAYNPKELKWFDIYSRLKVFEMGEVFYNVTPEFQEPLSLGWRGKKVKDVTRERNDKVTFIDYTIIPEIDIPQPIITRENRFNI